MDRGAWWTGEGFMPHGHCFFWEPWILWTHVVSDLLTGLAYLSIPAVLMVLRARRSDLAYPWVFVLFSTFIVACGLTHLVSIVTFWVPVYAVEGVVKAVTAGASVATAVALWPILPGVLALPSHAELEEANESLRTEVAARRAAEEKVRALAGELEARVVERTAELAEAVRQLELSNEDLGRFATSASHDLRAPLRTLNSYAELLERRYGEQLGAEGRELSELLVSEAQRMAAVIDGLLALSRVQTEANQPEVVALSHTFDAVHASLAADLAASGATLVRSDVLHAVQADPVHARLVLQNLVSNALTHGGPGPLTISVTTRDTGTGWVEVTVADDGVGIDSAYHDKVFEPFGRVSAAADGLGIGLAVCKRIVARYGGTIGIDGSVVQGACFRFTLPTGDPSRSPPPRSRQSQ